MLGPLLSDLDGTIADTAPVIFHSLRVTCAELGVELSRSDDLSWSLGPPLHWCLARLGVRADQLDEAVAVFERTHIERVDLVQPMPGADIILPELAHAGVLIGVATIKPQAIAELVLETIGLRQYVLCVHGRSDDFDPRTKTDLLRAAASELGGSGPLYVGDHDNDERAANDLGMLFLRYPNSSWEGIRAAVYGLRPMKPMNLS